MPKVAASVVFPVSSPPRRNAVVELDSNGVIISVSPGQVSFRELAGVEYYSGILVPGLVDVMCGHEKSSHWLLSRGVRVAGRIGMPPENDVSSVSTAGLTWKSRYDGMVSYRVFEDMECFRKLFKTGVMRGVCHVAHPEGAGPALAGFGLMEMMEVMIELQEGTAKPDLAVLLAMASLNGANALGFGDTTGSLTPGKKPGINIIEGADLIKMRLLPGSRLRRLF